VGRRSTLGTSHMGLRDARGAATDVGRPLALTAHQRQEAIQRLGEGHSQAYSPELNPAENIWQYLRQNQLSNRVFDSYEAIVDACCDAWNALTAEPGRIQSIATRPWASVTL
jgi:hypothetical protein